MADHVASLATFDGGCGKEALRMKKGIHEIPTSSPYALLCTKGTVQMK